MKMSFWWDIHPFARPLLLSSFLHGSLVLSTQSYLQNLAYKVERLDTLTVRPIGLVIKRGHPEGHSSLKRQDLLSSTIEGHHEKKSFISKRTPSSREEKESSEKQSSVASSQLGRVDGNGDEGGLKGVVGDPNGVEVTLKERYLYELSLVVEKHKLYPLLSKRRGEEGAVEVLLVIEKDGTLSNIAITRPAMFERLNQATLEIFHRIKKFKNFPDGLNIEKIKATQLIQYQLI